MSNPRPQRGAGRETQTVTRDEVGPAPAAAPQRGALAVVEPPADIGVCRISEGASAFLEGGPVEEVRNVPLISINHQEALFELPNGELVPTVAGYILYHFKTRRFYKKPPQPGQKGQRADCWSADMVVPHETSLEKQALQCATCKMNEWETGRDGRSKACAEHTWLFLLNPDFGNPPIACLTYPPSSIRVMEGTRFESGYLSQARAKYGAHQVAWTTLGLRQMGEQVKFCVLEPRMGPAADGDRGRQLRAFRDNFRAAMDGLRLKTPEAAAAAEES